MVVQDSLTYGPAISSDSVQDITFKLELPTIKLHEAPSVDEDLSHESKPAIRPTVSFRDDVGVRVRKVEVCSGTTARRERKLCSRYVIRILSKSHLVSVRCSVHRCISQRSHPIHGMQWTLVHHIIAVCIRREDFHKVDRCYHKPNMGKLCTCSAYCWTIFFSFFCIDSNGVSYLCIHIHEIMLACSLACSFSTNWFISWLSIRMPPQCFF